MIFVYLFWFLLSLAMYRRGQKITKTQFDDLGVISRGWFRPNPVQKYRAGRDAVKVGQFTKFCGFISIVVTIVDMLSGTAYFISAFILSTLAYNTVVAYLYPVQYYDIQNDGRLTAANQVRRPE